MSKQPIPSPDVNVISMSSLTRQERLTLENHTDLSTPAELFDRKVEALAELLDCSEAEATHILLHKL